MSHRLYCTLVIDSLSPKYVVYIAHPDKELIAAAVAMANLLRLRAYYDDELATNMSARSATLPWTFHLRYRNNLGHMQLP